MFWCNTFYKAKELYLRTNSGFQVYLRDTNIQLKDKNRELERLSTIKNVDVEATSMILRHRLDEFANGVLQETSMRERELARLAGKCVSLGAKLVKKRFTYFVDGCSSYVYDYRFLWGNGSKSFVDIKSIEPIHCLVEREQVISRVLDFRSSFRHLITSDCRLLSDHVSWAADLHIRTNAGVNALAAEVEVLPITYGELLFNESRILGRIRRVVRLN